MVVLQPDSPPRPIAPWGIAPCASGTFALGEFGIPLLFVGLLGALIGSQLGAVRFSGAGVRRALGAILAIAVGAYWLKFL
jgi:hypothetical protein